MIKREQQLNINRAFLPALQNKKRYLVLYGGAGSGKSVFAAQKFLIRLFSEHNQRFLFIRKTKASIKESVYAQIKQLAIDYDLLKFVEYGVSPMKFRSKLTGSEILFYGCDDPEKLKSITNITSIWLEEATNLTRHDFQEIDIRLRGQTKYYQQIVLTFNPISANHWIYEHFFNTPSPNVAAELTTLKTTYKDNPTLPANYRQSLEDLRYTDNRKYMVSCLGEWGVSDGNIYKFFNTFSVPPYREPDQTIYGLDFGYANPTALIQVDEYDGKYYIYERIYHRALTTGDLVDRLKFLITDRTDYIYCDSAQPDRIEELKRQGFNAHPSNKDVKNGILTVKDFHKDILSHNDNTNLIDEVMSYSYKQNRDGHFLEEPQKENDHALDALRYALHTHYKRGKKKAAINFY